MRNRHFLPLVIAAMFFANGCATDLEKPASKPATTASSGELNLSDAKPLDDLESDDVQVNLTDKLTAPQINQTVYFGEADDVDPNDDDQTVISAIPLIAIKKGGDWKAVPLIGPGLRDAGWRYVGAGPKPHEVWGVLDTAAGDSRSNFVVAHSIDGADTFTLKVFHKPCKLATVSDFAMSRTGQGRVTLSLDADCGSVKAGLYHYETTDHGQTWSKTPRYEPDAMIRADTVPDDEQPDQPEAAPMKTMFIPTTNARVSR